MIWTNASNDKVDYIGTDAEISEVVYSYFNASDKNRNAELKVELLRKIMVVVQPGKLLPHSSRTIQ